MDLPLVAPVRPMLATAVAHVPDPLDGYIVEPKWDGFRVLVFRPGDDVVLQSRSGKDLSRYFPEILDAVRDVLPDRVVLDGEIVVAIDGRLEFDVLSQRVHPAASRVARLADETPATLVLFDLLALGDDDLTARPWADRRAVLESLALDDPRIHRTPVTDDLATARRWFEVFEGAGLDGVIVKGVDSAYAPGGRTMLKVKHERTADVVVAGYRLHKDSEASEPLVGSLLLGLYDDGGHLVFVGGASAFSRDRRAELAVELAPLAGVSGHPWSADGDGHGPTGASRWSAGKEPRVVLLAPERVAEVAYDHMEGRRFRHTVQMRRWRPDREVRSCGFDQLEEPASYDLSAVLPGAPGVG